MAIFKTLADMQTHMRALSESRRTAALFRDLNKTSGFMPTLNAGELRALNNQRERTAAVTNLGKLRTQRAARTARSLLLQSNRQVAGAAATKATAQLKTGLSAARAVANTPLRSLVASGLKAPGVGLAAQFAYEGVKSGITQGTKMLKDVGATGGFSKEGWKNLMSVEGVKDIGKGLVGSVMDVASGMTMGYLPNGDKVRDTMSVNRSPYETPVSVNRSPFKGTDAGGTAVALQSKAAERRAGLSLAADGAAPMTSDQTAAEEARAKSAETGANYWTQVELANKANSNYADGVISKEERDRIVAGSEAAKGGTGQSGDPGLAGYKSTFGLKGQTDEKPADQLNENIAKQNQQAKRSAEFNAYKTVTERQDAELSDVQKAANDLEKPGVSEANHALAKAKTNIELLQTEDKLQAQRDAAEIAQIMGDANEYATPEEDDRLQNPVDRFIAAGQRQHERETARDPLPQIEVDQINRETDALTQSVAQQQQQPVQQQPAEQTTVQTAEDDAKKRSNGDQADEKGGDGDRFATSRNFLATDRVPDTIFGYPVVSRREDYTEEDIAFFRDHPEAGGYYDLGEGSPEDGTEEGLPVQDDEPAGERLRRRAGDAAEVLDYAGSAAERGLARVADAGIPLVSGAAKVLKPAVVGARAALANVASGGGRYYQPEVRDERNFSRDELASIAANLERHGGRSANRYGYTGDLATRWANSQSIGGASVREGRVTDMFDVDTKDPYGLSSGLHEAADVHAERGNMARAVAFGAAGNLVDMGHRFLGAVFGNENDPAEGKVRTEIPVDRLPDRGDQGAVKGGASAGAPLHAAGPDADATRIESAIAEAVPFVKAHEGFRKDAYWDGIGKRWTVGYGQTEIADPLTGRVRPVRKGDTVTEAAASAFVADRVRSDAARLHRDHPRWAADLSPGALAALYDISYNMGADALLARRSPTLNSELDSADMDFDSIVWQEVPTYVHAGGRKVKGLENRRNDAIKKWRRT